MSKDRKKKKRQRKNSEIRQDLVESSRALVKIGFYELDQVADEVVDKAIEDLQLDSEKED